MVNLMSPRPSAKEDSCPGIDFEQHLRQLENAPSWWIDLKRRAWRRFHSLPFPNRKNESWRFTRTRDLDPSPFHLSAKVPGEADDRTFLPSNQTGPVSGKINLADERLVEALPMDVSLRASGVVWTTLRQAIREHGELLRAFFMTRTPELGSEKFSALHAALASNGVFLYVPRGVEVELPFVASHRICGDGLAVFPHTLIVTEENARVSLIDFYSSARSGQKNYVCAGADIFAGPGSRVSYKAVQDWNRHTRCFHLNTATAHRNADIKSINLNLGAAYMRHEHHTRMVGPGSKVRTFSLSVSTGKQEFDQRTLQTHEAPHAHSNLLFKNALFDESRTIFSGLIRVEEEAQQTDAYQTNNNLLLSSAAVANSLPGLEILANDVKCSHGATTGQLDEEQLYYLLSRGIPKRTAWELLVSGFFEEVIGQLESDELAENVRLLIRQKFQNA